VKAQSGLDGSKRSATEVDRLIVSIRPCPIRPARYLAAAGVRSLSIALPVIGRATPTSAVATATAKSTSISVNPPA
jgi:hypothetical protein